MEYGVAQGRGLPPHQLRFKRITMQLRQNNSLMEGTRENFYTKVE